MFRPAWWSIFGLRSTFLLLLALFCQGLELSFFSNASAEETSATASTGDIVRWIGELGDDQFAVRREARRRLRERLTDASSVGETTLRLQRALTTSELSAEARFEIRSLLSSELALASGEPIAPISERQIAAIIDELNDSRYAVRAAAQARLALLCRDAAMATRSMAPLKSKLADPTMDRDYREAVEATWRTARDQWLKDETLDRLLPEPTDEQIDHWIKQLTAPSENTPDVEFARNVAELELVDLLCREACRPRTIARLQALLATEIDDVSSAHVNRVLDWTRPAMVAEIWLNRRHETTQYLLVNVPQSPEGFKVTLFDRIDDRVAHCVSGNALYEGDWPVGVAIAHPQGKEWMLTLVNLPTPRRRQVYEIDVLRPEPERLRDLTERTFRRLIAEKRHIGEIDARALGQLDPAAVSRCVGDYFAAIPDRPLGWKDANDQQYTEHDLICIGLMDWGLNSAQPALDRLAEARGELVKPEKLPLARLANLSIAARDPWTGVDAWLVKLIRTPAEFRTPEGKQADLSATAAAILLRRHQQSAEEFGLEPLDAAPNANAAGFQLYRFSDPAGRERVMRWWSTQEQRQAERRNAAIERAARR
jgi:hypothetical protein